ncbi:MAG TPA: hypothetical protein VGE42_09720 [Candidatus Dormibacteraeota bacterium]
MSESLRPAARRATVADVPALARSLARGFAVTGEVRLPRGPMLWLMTRAPGGR